MLSFVIMIFVVRGSHSFAANRLTGRIVCGAARWSVKTRAAMTVVSIRSHTKPLWTKVVRRDIGELRWKRIQLANQLIGIRRFKAVPGCGVT